MPDFSALLRKPAGEAKRPPLLPGGDYMGVVKSFEMGESSQKKTPFVRFNVVLQDWPTSAPQEWQVPGPDGKSMVQISRSDVDLSKRQMRRDFFFTEDALYRLDEFLRSCGISVEGRTYEEALPDVVGATVVAEVQQQMSQREGATADDMFNQIGRLSGTA